MEDASQEQTKGLLNLTTKPRMEKVKPRTDKRPIKYEGCLMTGMYILIQYWISVVYVNSFIHMGLNNDMLSA